MHAVWVRSPELSTKQTLCHKLPSHLIEWPVFIGGGDHLKIVSQQYEILRSMATTMAPVLQQPERCAVFQIPSVQTCGRCGVHCVGQ
jgi:hypothetical protein